jgi:tetratricopeptide (TPR) repeat protein
VLLEAGRPAEAVAAFREAVRLDPGEVTFRVGLARSLRQTGALADALAEIQEALRIDPDHLAANQVAALVLKARGDDAAASRHLARGRIYSADVVRDPWFREVQRLGTTVAGALVQAEYFLENGRSECAVKLLDPIAKSNPDRADVHKKLAKALALSGNFPRARESYARAVSLDPGDARTRADLASVLLDLGDLDGALREARGALVADATLHDARVVIAAARLRTGDAWGALGDVEAVLRSRPDLVLAQITRGDALLALGRPAEAIPSYESALKLSPGMPYATGRLAEARKAAARRASDTR